jgi:hypothetical protein
VVQPSRQSASLAIKAIVMVQTATTILREPRAVSLLPRLRDLMARAYSAAEAERIYLNAHHLVDGTSSAGRVYLADLAEALGITPIRWRALQRAAEQAPPARRAGSAIT